MVHAQEMDTHISVGDIGQIFRKWLLFLKPDIVELLKSYIVLKFLKSEIIVELLPKSAIVVPEFLMSDSVLELLMSDIGPSC